MKAKSLPKSLPSFILVFMMMGFLTHIKAQPQGFVPMDESMEGLLKFYQTDTILVVYPEQYLIRKEDREAIEDLVFWQDKPVYQYKSQSELVEPDLGKHIQFFGPAYRFSIDSLFDSPLAIHENGFSYRGQNYNDPSDAFYYMHDSGQRIYTCRNGEVHPLVYIAFFAAPYQLYIFKGNDIKISGFDQKNASPLINDMDALRKEYFCQQINSQYFRLFFSCSIPEEDISSTLGEELDLYVNDLCRYLNLECDSIKPVTNYFYNTREELQYFIAAPKWQTIYGKSFGDINHITGLNLEIFKHEAGHSVIGSKLGMHPSPFFSEGFRQYTDYFFSSQAYENDLRIFRENPDLLTIDLIVSGNTGFFTNLAHYNISGIFVKFMIDQLGLEAFKAAYTEQSIDALLAERELNFAKFIEDCKRSIL